jgi:hypothetical protein
VNQNKGKDEVESAYKALEAALKVSLFIILINLCSQICRRVSIYASIVRTPAHITSADTSLPPDADYLNLIKASTKIVRPFMSQNRALLQYCHEVVKLYNAVAANKREDKEAGIGE